MRPISTSKKKRKNLIHYCLLLNRTGSIDFHPNLTKSFLTKGENNRSTRRDYPFTPYLKAYFGSNDN